MVSKLIQIWDTLKTIINAVSENLSEIIKQLDAVVFNSSDTTIWKLFGLIHYVADTPIYIMFCITLQIGFGILLFRLVTMVWNLIMNFFPGLKALGLSKIFPG